jgi:hypothetical protein
VGYSIAPELQASIGYYYQNGDLNSADGSGVRARLSYNLTNGLTVGANLTYDQAFDTRISGDIKYRFGANGYGAPSIRKQQPVVMPVIQALSATPANRDVRVHDGFFSGGLAYLYSYLTPGPGRPGVNIHDDGCYGNVPGSCPPRVEAPRPSCGRQCQIEKKVVSAREEALARAAIACAATPRPEWCSSVFK